MDCRAFRRNHVAFVDDTLPGVVVVRMQDHLVDCATCSTLDHRVRRSLLIARNNAPRLELSPAFSGRLAQRLEEERRRRVARPAARPFPMPLRALAIGCTLTVIFVATSLPRLQSEAQGLAEVEPVLSRADMLTPRGSAEATPAYVASFSTGMAIIPALLLVDEVPFDWAYETTGFPAAR